MIENNYFTIMSIIAAIHIGFLAFVYPKIIEIKTEFQNNFPEIYKDFSRNFSIKSYLYFISGFLLLNILCLIISVTLSQPILINLNLFCAAIAIILNATVVITIQQYRFNIDDIYLKKLTSINFKKNLSKHNLLDGFWTICDSIQTQILFFVHKNLFDMQRIRKYLGYYNTIIQNYIKWCKDTNKKHHSSNDANNQYYEYPMNRMGYINQIACNTDKIDISVAIAYNSLDLLKVCKKSDVIMLFGEFKGHAKSIYLYAINNDKFSTLHVYPAFDFYIELLSREHRGEFNFFDGQYAVSWLWDITKCMIDNNISEKKFLFLKEKLEYLVSPHIQSLIKDDLTDVSTKIIHPHIHRSTLYKLYIILLTRLNSVAYNNYVQLHIENFNDLRGYIHKSTQELSIKIIAYLLFKRKLELCKKFIGSTNKIYPLIPKNINTIIEIFFTENFVRKHKDNYNDYTQDTLWIYHAMFLCMSVIADKVFKCEKIVNGKKSADFDKKHCKNNIDIYTSTEIIKSNKNNFICLSHTEKYIKEQLDIFLDDNELMKMFNLNYSKTKYRDFILKYIKKINKEIKTRI